MWRVTSSPLTTGGTAHRVTRGGKAASRAVVLSALADDANCRAALTDALAASRFAAFRFETPAWTAATMGAPFEFVLIDDPSLDRTPDRSAFAEHFAAGAAVATFANLRGDATLVVPCPVAADDAYRHLASFVRGAPDGQRHALWAAVAAATAAKVGARPVWLSTAGAGVAWLHVRIDDRPKYYAHGPYRTA